MAYKTKTRKMYKRKSGHKRWEGKKKKKKTGRKKRGTVFFKNLGKGLENIFTGKINWKKAGKKVKKTVY